MTSRPSVLVVDDDEMAGDMLARRLDRQGFRASTAASGEEAIRRVAEAPFDLVMLDIEMPGLNGFDVLLQLRKRYSQASLPVIMATANHDSETVVRALKAGANDYVTKPLDFPVVLPAPPRAQRRLLGLAGRRRPRVFLAALEGHAGVRGRRDRRQPRGVVLARTRR
jgi:DNA-binding response OmpR family regulator